MLGLTHRISDRVCNFSSKEQQWIWGYHAAVVDMDILQRTTGFKSYNRHKECSENLRNSVFCLYYALFRHF